MMSTARTVPSAVRGCPVEHFEPVYPDCHRYCSKLYLDINELFFVIYDYSLLGYNLCYTVFLFFVLGAGLPAGGGMGGPFLEFLTGFLGRSP